MHYGYIAFVISCLVLGSCSTKPGYQDPQLQLTRQDYRQLNTAPAEVSQAPEPISAIPALLPSVAAAEQLAPDRIVTISVTPATPLRDVFTALGHEAEVDIEVDPRVEGGITFTATKRPFDEVIGNIVQLAGLRATVKGRTLLVLPDEPYMQTYEVPFLSLSRKVDSDDHISTEVSAPGAASGGTGTYSRSVVSTNSATDFFGDLEKSLDSILKETSVKGQPAGSADINRQAGLISVYGTARQQKVVQDFLRPLRQAASAQVQIEAKVLEVTLDEAYNSGINWSSLTKIAGVGTVAVNPAFATDVGLGTMLGQGTGASTFAVQGGDLTGIINFVSSFGTVRTLSSPRITVLNNQTAMLKVADNQVFFDVKVTRQDQSTALGTISTANPVITVTSDIRTVPIGLVMAVQPAINMATREITMTLRPTITRVTNLIDDPAVQYINSTLPSGQTPITAQVPEIQVREFDSVLRMTSGSVAVLGGLMQQSANNLDRGIPGLKDVPTVGYLFKTRGEDNQTTELVVLLKADIAADSLPTAADHRLYEGYSSDPRPFQF